MEEEETQQVHNSLSLSIVTLTFFEFFVLFLVARVHRAPRGISVYDESLHMHTHVE